MALDDSDLRMFERKFDALHEELGLIEGRLANIDDDLPTPRERIATAVLAALLSRLGAGNPSDAAAQKKCVQDAIAFADALLEGLDAPQSTETKEPG